MNDPIFFFTTAVFFLEFHPDQTGWNFPYELRPQICPGNQASKVLLGNRTHMKRAFGGLSESFSQNSVMVFEWDSGYKFSHQALNTTMITLSVWLSLLPKKNYVRFCCVFQNWILSPDYIQEKTFLVFKRVLHFVETTTKAPIITWRKVKKTSYVHNWNFLDSMKNWNDCTRWL